ncbi:hypothetical protein C1645_811419 [Glomus cerebriforme]|uniref:Uncharacterized protein n=1 Tax=Glomus cerebriforme TaxID=658196 RepID=A0A397TR51_9GLOM|nr:hypothetical protein C1645_811419 [Glomus cerebriforme]
MEMKNITEPQTEDCNKKFLALTQAYYITKAYKKAKAETNEGAKVKVKKKRSLVGEHYYEEFSMEF